MKNKLLSTTAAAALIISSATVFAQTSSSPSSGGAPGASQQERSSPSMDSGSARERSVQSPRERRSQAQERRGSREDMNTGRATSSEAAPSDQGAQERNRSREQARDRDANRGQARDSERRRETRSERERDRNATSRRDDQLNTRMDRRDRSMQERTQSERTGERSRTQTSTTRSESGARVSLSQDQQTRVRNVIDRRGVRARTDVNFSISVGAAVPRRVRVHTLPPEIVEIVPQYRGYKYVVARDEIVIIHPRTRKVVTVISDSRMTGSRPRGDRLTLSTEQKRLIRRHATVRSKAPDDLRLSVGAALPETVELHAFPDVVYTEAPMLRSYRYVVVDDDIVLVDPDEHRVVEVIE